ncbi:Rep_fac-A_C domain-containing protein [Raphanus sativus]|nr:Rep_fac-A_C domain-containing protein [Raphanus sativus]
MSTCDAAIVAPTSFDAIRLGRSAQFIVARLLCFWDSRNIMKQGEFMGITLLFLDEQNSVNPKNIWSLGGSVEEAFSCIDTKEEIKKKEHVSIGELKKFIPTLMIRFHVELSVDDGHNNATFVVFDREMLKLTKKDAAALTVDEINGGGGEQLLQCLEELGGKEFVFQIRVTPFNFTQNHHTFTVSGISDHIEPETFNNNEASIVGVESGQASASASTLFEGECMIQIQPVLRGRSLTQDAPYPSIKCSNLSLL